MQDGGSCASDVHSCQWCTPSLTLAWNQVAYGYSCFVVAGVMTLLLFECMDKCTVSIALRVQLHLHSPYLGSQSTVMLVVGNDVSDDALLLCDFLMYARKCRGSQRMVGSHSKNGHCQWDLLGPSPRASEGSNRLDNRTLYSVMCQRR